MFEKVNPSHPDKVADRIAGAIVDLAYRTPDNKKHDPKVAAEVLIGHGKCFIVIESSGPLKEEDIRAAVKRISGIDEVEIIQTPQDPQLWYNQEKGFRCGDNGIFRGVPVTDEQARLTAFVRSMCAKYPSDGKFILDGDRMIICQSNASINDLREMAPDAIINPLGDWTGGLDVDTGATNRKLGSDMGDSVTGGGLHGKDLSKADVSVNIYAWLKAQVTGEPVELCCAIGDEEIDGYPYSEIVEVARKYIRNLGGFERFAEWGLIR